jgi:hypothetical protein
MGGIIRELGNSNWRIRGLENFGLKHDLSSQTCCRLRVMWYVEHLSSVIIVAEQVGEF